MSKMCLSQPHKCKCLLLVFVLYASKWRIFGFWTDAWTKEAMWVIGHFQLREIVLNRLIVKIIGRISYREVYCELQQSWVNKNSQVLFISQGNLMTINVIDIWNSAKVNEAVCVHNCASLDDISEALGLIHTQNSMACFMSHSIYLLHLHQPL